MPSSGKQQAARDELIRNARFVNLPDRRFLERMQPQARQEVRYGLHSTVNDIDIRLEVLASGVMMVETCIPHAVIEDGVLRVSSDAESVLWSDTDEIAMIPTRLGRRHLMGEITTELVVDAFLGAFGVHTSALGDLGYDHWHTAMELYGGVIAAEMDAPVEMIHHLPLIMPYSVDAGGKSPLIAEASCHIYDISDDSLAEEQIQYRPPVMKIQKLLQPVAMELVLHLPNLVVRKQHRVVFEAAPDGRPLADHIRDFSDHMNQAQDVRQSA